MEVQNEYDELLYAYALGCLDIPDLDKFKNYIDSGGEFSRQSLGELQNLAALFPSILSMEIPSPQLKDKVARKLYRINSERPDKKTGEKAVKPMPPIQPTETEEKQDEKEEQSKETIKEPSEFAETNNFNSELETEEELPGEEEVYNLEEDTTLTEQVQDQDIQEFEVVTARTKEQVPESPGEEDKSAKVETLEHSADDSIINEETLSVDFTEPETEESSDEKNTVEEYASSGVTLKEREPYSSFRKRKVPEKKSSKAGIIAATILFIIVAAGLIFVYLKVSSDVSVYKNSVDKLNRKINSLSTQVNNNRDLQKLLSTKNVKIVNLSGTKAGVPGFGKLIISFENSKGYLQLSNVPPLAGSDSYMLWVIINGKYTSLGTFKPSGYPPDKVEYFPFQLPELSNNGGTKFLVSEEPPGTPKRPSRQIILTGTLQ